MCPTSSSNGWRYDAVTNCGYLVIRITSTKEITFCGLFDTVGTGYLKNLFTDLHQIGTGILPVLSNWKKYI